MPGGGGTPLKSQNSEGKAGGSEFEVSMVSIVNSRTVRDVTQRNPVSKKERGEEKKRIPILATLATKTKHHGQPDHDVSYSSVTEPASFEEKYGSLGSL